ncbi:MAG: NAD-dependent epimerase/dehydratase family protein [Elusimicrobiota bacterium]
MKFKKVLVTGGAGCIGIEVCKNLERRGIPTHLLDVTEQVARTKHALPKSVRIFYGSILDTSTIREAIEGCDAVIHLAAMLGVKRTEVNKLRCLEINIEGTKNVIDCCIQHRVKKIVFASSSEVYGEPFENPVNEKTPTQGKTVYAVSKLAAEELCKGYAQRYPLDYTILRYFNTYGQYQTAQFVLPKFILNALNGRPPIIYGDGDQLRSFCYASDTADGTVRALLSDKASGEVFNIGNSQQKMSLKELANLVLEVTHKDKRITPVFKKGFIGADRVATREINIRFCNISKAKEILGYEPKVDLVTGIKKLSEPGVIFEKWETTELPYLQEENS